jgi:hypothetical protein
MNKSQVPIQRKPPPSVCKNGKMVKLNFKKILKAQVFPSAAVFTLKWQNTVTSQASFASV